MVEIFKKERQPQISILANETMDPVSMVQTTQKMTILLSNIHSNDDGHPFIKWG